MNKHVARIRFATDILRRLGEELNPTLDQSVLELVKNSYDADASYCRVEFSQEDGENIVRVTDDGVGMRVSDIHDGFLVLGASGKKKSARTLAGRTPAGSKGLGRLAALRMGKWVDLVTKPKSLPLLEHHLRIDWTEYEDASLVDNVQLTITSSKRNAKSFPGTTRIVIGGVPAAPSRSEIKRLARSLILLSDPFGDDVAGFKPQLVATEYSDLQKLVDRRYFTDADYHLTAKVDGSGKASAVVTDWKGETLFQATHDDIASPRKGLAYECGEVEFEFWAFVLDKEAFQSRRVSIAEVQGWLEFFGGVHFYENGLRVAPYGNPGNDWLDLNLARVKSPEERPSTNNSIGRIRVHDTRDLLKQKTDRSGYVETHAFADIKEFANSSLSWMARRRMHEAERRRAFNRSHAPKVSKKQKDALVNALAAVPIGPRKKVEAALENYDKSHQQEVKELRREVQLYRTLSTAGITAATFAHESQGNPIKKIALATTSIEHRIKNLVTREVFDDRFVKSVRAIRDAIDSLAVLGRATLGLLAHEKRKLGRVEVHEVLEQIVATLAPFSKGRDVSIELVLLSGRPFMRASAAAIESVFANLVNNSLAALEDVVDQRRIVIRTSLVPGPKLAVTVMDNGPGLDGLSLEDIWLPGNTTKAEGTGLGLTIVKDSVADLGGSVSATSPGALGGFDVLVTLPLLGVDS